MSEIRTDTISAANGTDPVTLTKQSAAKAWLSKYSNSAATIGGSLGVSSVTDVGSGNATVNFTNSFNDANYSHTASDANFGMCQTEPFSQTASTGKIYSYNSSFVLTDTTKNSVAHGDLA